MLPSLEPLHWNLVYLFKGSKLRPGNQGIRKLFQLCVKKDTLPTDTVQSALSIKSQSLRICPNLRYTYVCVEKKQHTSQDNMTGRHADINMPILP